MFESLLDDLIYKAVEHGTWIGHAQLVPLESRSIEKALMNLNLDVVTRYEEKVLQPKILQQVVFNLCGYHALFSVLNITNFFLSGFERYIQNLNDSAVFWRFKIRTSRFLEKFPVDSKLKLGKFWTKEWCHIGDLERSHMKIIIENSAEFISTFSQSKDFLTLHFTLEFQFSNFVTPLEKLAKFQQMVNQFRNTRKGVFGIFIGACNHWVSLVAYKSPYNQEYVFLDSRNKDYLHWSPEKIEEEIENYSHQRIKDGMRPLCQFRKMVGKQCIKDIQKVVKFIVDVFEGKVNAVDYFAHNNFVTYYENNYASFFETTSAMLREGKKDELITYCGTEFHSLKHSTEHLSSIVTDGNSLTLESKTLIANIVNEHSEVLEFLRKNLKKNFARQAVLNIGVMLDGVESWNLYRKKKQV